MTREYPPGQGPLIVNDVRYSKYEESEHFFGPNGKYLKIPFPLRQQYNVRSPQIIIAAPTGNGSKTACLRWFGKVLGDEERTKRMKGFQYLFPLCFDPFAEQLHFAEDGDPVKIFSNQVTSIDNKKYLFGDGTNDEIQFVCYDRKPMCIVHAEIVLLAHPRFGVIHPEWYGDPARGNSNIMRIKVKAREEVPA